MNSDKTLGVYTANGGHAALNSGATTFTGESVLTLGCSEVMAGLAYKVPDDVGITFTWGLQYSTDNSNWTTISETTAVTTFVAAATFTNVYGYLDNLPRYSDGGFIRVYGVAANFTNDTIQVFSWLNLGRDNGQIMNQSIFRSGFAFDVTDSGNP